MKKIFILTTLFLCLLFHTRAQTFEVSFAPGLIKESFSGNVLLYLSKENKSPKDIRVGTELTPVYRILVENLRGGEIANFNDQATSYPVELSNIERGEYYAQVVFDVNEGGSTIAQSPGNIYSLPLKFNLTKNFDELFRIEATRLVEPLEFTETPRLKELNVKSKLLSRFHNKDIFVNAAVSLPDGYQDNPAQTYPVIFRIFGFGGHYKTHSGKGKHKFDHLGTQPAILVYLDGGCPEGHSTYANSDVNGPWGDALVNEFIPTLAKEFRSDGAYFLFGHSSGGWASLWLQINYPKTFAGTWSSAPDQVDFRNYQNKNIYEANNFFYDEGGNLLYDVTIAGRIPVISAKDFYRTENVIYRGGQMHSFDAVFGGYDEKGSRIRLLDPNTGIINQKALSLWRRYDLSILLSEKWSNLEKDLDDKIKISIGESDNFHLHHSVRLLDEEMKKRKANIAFEYFPGDHFTLFTDDYHKKGMAFLEQCYQKWLEKNK